VINGIVLAMSLYSSPVFAQPTPGYTLKKITQTKLDVKQKKSPALFKIKTGVFCTTPIESSNGTLVTGCDDATIRFVSNAGVLLKTIKVEHDPNTGMSANPELIALKSKSEQYIVTSYGDHLIMKFDSSGKVISKTKLEASVSKPYGFDNGDYFFLDSDGVGHFIFDDKPALTVPISASDLNTPSARVNSKGEEEVVVSDGHGTLFVVHSSGEKKMIQVSQRGLSDVKFAPDGKVWLSDQSGMMYIVDLETADVKSFKVPLAKLFNRPVFLKNGKVAFGAGETIFIYSLQNLERPEAVYDTKIHQTEFENGELSTYLGSPMAGVDLSVVELADGSEYIWVPTHGGYHFIDDRGAIAGYLSFGANLGDAESFSPPSRLKDGSFAIGMYCGIDRITISKNASGQQITSGAWVP